MTVEMTLLQAKIKVLELENSIMGILSSRKGFYGFYTSSMWRFAGQEDCFDYCNKYFYDIFGSFKYENYQSFLSDNAKNIIVASSSIDAIERDFLISWFKHKGFDTWTSFKALVMHYYPTLTEINLLNFYKGTSIDADTRKCVSYVKQIIG